VVNCKTDYSAAFYCAAGLNMSDWGGNLYSFMIVSKKGVVVISILLPIVKTYIFMYMAALKP